MPLTECDIQAAQSRLENLKASLEDAIEMARKASEPVALDQSLQGRVSRGDALQQQEMAKANLSRNQMHLRRVIASLARITKEEYGYCLECGEDIPFARLNIMPDAEYCIQCCEKHEQIDQ